MAKAESILPNSRQELTLIAARAQEAMSRIMPVIGDSCEPKFPAGSFVVVKPATKYEGPYEYVWHDGLGPVIVSAEAVIRRRGEPRMCRFGYINGRYSNYEWPMEKFEASILGRVVAHLSIIDKELLSTIS